MKNKNEVEIITLFQVFYQLIDLVVISKYHM